jgi:hypothetical protein
LRREAVLIVIDIDWQYDCFLVWPIDLQLIADDAQGID